MAVNGGFDLEWRLVAEKDCGNSQVIFSIKQNQIITRTVKPVPSEGGYMAPKLLCLKLRTIVVSS